MSHSRSAPLNEEDKKTWFREKFRPDFDVWVTEPARKMAYRSPDGYGMPAFVWLSCAIEWLASFHFGKNTRNNTQDAYVGFMKSYFPVAYNAGELYKCLRNGLVHLYTIKESKYVLTDNRPDLHLTNDSAGRIILNLENFYLDFFLAKEKYFDDVEEKTELWKKFLQRYERDGFMELVPLKLT